MKAALLNLARAELDHIGYVSADTRYRLARHGITSVTLEQYLAITTGAN